MDNCPETPNPGQGDDDGDMLGDACDPCPGNTRNLGLAEGGACDATSAALFRINSGGGTYVDTGGLTWGADFGFSGGNTFSTADAIAGTPDDPIYQTERFGAAFTYSLNAGADADYLVNLHFAEIASMRTGSASSTYRCPTPSTR